MPDVPIKNDGTTDRYVGGVLISPGETRLLPEELVPTNLRPEDGAPVIQGAAEATETDDAQTDAQRSNEHDEELNALLAQTEPEISEAGQEQALGELLARTVPEIAAVLPNLNADDLERLEALEQQAEKPRKGVLEAIAEEWLKRGQGE